MPGVRFACITDVTNLAQATDDGLNLTDEERIDFGRGWQACPGGKGLEEVTVRLLFRLTRQPLIGGFRVVRSGLGTTVSTFGPLISSSASSRRIPRTRKHEPFGRERPSTLVACVPFSDAFHFGCEWIRKKTLSPGGRPQMVSFTPFRKELVRTFTANQLVPPKLVEYCGLAVQVLVPV